MLEVLRPNARFSLDLENRTLVNVRTGATYNEDEISSVDTDFYGYETKKPYSWYLGFLTYDIRLIDSLRKYVNDIEIRKCGKNHTVMTRDIVQCKKPVILTNNDVEFAVLFRFGDVAISKDGTVVDLNSGHILRSLVGTDPIKETLYRLLS